MAETTPPADGLPSYAELSERSDAPRGTNWGLFGRDDQLGTVNLLTPARVKAAAASIRKGVSFGLNWRIDLPDPPLFGRGALASALIEMWNRRVEFHLFLPVATVFQHLHPAMKIMIDPQVAAWGEANKPRVLEFLRFLDGELQNRPFVAGPDYSVADITALVAVDFMRVSKLAVPDDLIHVRRWHETVSARPSAVA